MNILTPLPAAEAFRAFMNEKFGASPKEVIADGEIHRFSIKPNRRDDCGWYVLHDDGFPAGVAGDWSSGNSFKWTARGASDLSAEEKKRIEKLKAERDRKRREIEKRAAENARKKWDSASPAGDGHPYLIRKGVRSHGLRQSDGRLLVPVVIDAEIKSLQSIDAESDKLFSPGSQVAGGFYLIGESTDNAIVVAEGYATGATIHEATGLAVAVAFNASNLYAVCKTIRAQRPTTSIIVAADDDWKTEQHRGFNPGLREAKKAAKAVDGKVIVPPFDRAVGEDGSDFNDLAALRGLNAVKNRFDQLLGKRRRDRERAAAEHGSEHHVSYGSFKMDNGGLYVEVERGRGEHRSVEDVWVSGSFEILGACRDSSGRAWGKWIKWRDADGREHFRHVSDASLHGDPSAICAALADDGLRISRNQQRPFVDYLSGAKVEGRVTLVSHTGWHEIVDRAVFVLPHETIRPSGGETVILDAAATENYERRGTLEKWKTSVSTLAIGHALAVLAISAALAGPLLDVAGQDGGGVHFHGLSSKGKTTLQRAAASVWGKGATPGYIRSWRATANGLEGAAAGATDTCLVLDEIGVVEARELAAAIYGLANGTGKQRAQKDGSLREPKSWRVLVISSGEIPVETKLSEDKGRRSRAGQLVRMLDIPADRGKGFGVFDSAGPDGDAAKLADSFKASATKAYGTAGPAFVRRLIEEKVDAGIVCSMISDFVASAVPYGADGQVTRAAQRLGLFAAAGELASKFGIVAWSPGAATSAAKEALAAWIDQRGGTESAEARQHVSAVRLIIEQHGDARFQDIDGNDEKPVVNRLGWRSGSGRAREWWILPEIWKSEVCNGLNPRQVAETLCERGMLIKDGDSYQARRRVGEKRIRFYVLTHKVLAGGDIDGGDDET